MPLRLPPCGDDAVRDTYRYLTLTLPARVSLISLASSPLLFVFRFPTAVV